MKEALLKRIRLLLTSAVLAFPTLALAREHHHHHTRAAEMTQVGLIAAAIVGILGYLYTRNRRAARQGS